MDEHKVSTFMEVTSCESQAHAVQHLGSCRWDLDEAISLYFNSDGGTKPLGLSGQILPDEDAPVKEDKDCYGYNYEDDMCDPLPSSAALDSSSIVNEAPCPALGEIVATGWGGAEAEADDGGQTGVESVDGGQVAHDVADAEREDDIGGEGDDCSMRSSNREEYGGYNYEGDSEHYDDTSDSEDDDDEDYYASIAVDTDAGGEQPWPAPQRQPGTTDTLEELFRPPFDLMYHGSFHNAKVHAAREDRLLLVNLQTRNGAGDFASQMQNRDLWADELVKNVIQNSFVFFLLERMEDYSHLDQCTKVSFFYNLEDDQLPVVLVLDPITGQLLAKRIGTMMPDEFMQYIDEFMNSKPSTLSKPKFIDKTQMFPASVGVGGEQDLASASAAAKTAAPESSAPAADEVGEQELEIPNNSAATGGACSDPLPVPKTELPAEMIDDDNEPMEGEKMYKLRIRFPSGTTITKEFGCKRRVALLFAFCRTALHGGGQAEKKAMRIMRFVGRALEAIQEDGGATFEDLGLNCAAVTVIFDS